MTVTKENPMTETPNVKRPMSPRRKRYWTALGLANGAAPRATDAEGIKEIAAQPSTVLPPKPEPATVRALPVSGTISLTTPPPRP